MKRTTLLTALYGTDSRIELLTQFDSKLSEVNKKDNVSKRYTHLLEQVLFFSHAIIFDQAVQTIHNYRQSFMKKARDNKTLNLSDSKINEAFKFFNRTVYTELATLEEQLTKAEKELAEEPSNQKLLEKVSELKERISGSEVTTSVATKDNTSSCVAKEEIARLKEELDTESYKLARGQRADDKEAFIMIAIIAMATGVRLQDIVPQGNNKGLSITTKKGIVYFDGVESKIVGIDSKQAQSYLRAIRKHYDYTIRLKEAKRLLAKTEKSDIKAIESLKKTIIQMTALSQKQEKGEFIDIGNGVRKNIKKLSIKNGSNLNHLNTLYKDCIK